MHLLLLVGTFHLGHLVLELDYMLHVPILLWGLPELPYNGGKIRLNSVCGVNLNASNLYKSGNKTYHVHVGNSIDIDWLDAVRISAVFKRTNLGVLGYRAKGFFNLGVYDLNVFSEMGILINHYEITEVWNYHVQQSEIDKRKAQVLSIFEVSELNEFQIEKVAELTAKLAAFMKDNNLNAPCNPFAGLSLPQSLGSLLVQPCLFFKVNTLSLPVKVISRGALSMVAHKAIGGETPYLFDFSQIDFEEDNALLWHCGVAPCNLWDEKCTRSLSTYFAGGKGVTADFRSKKW